MQFTIQYSEYMEYEEDIEAVSIDEAKRKFEEAVSNGEVEPTQARIIEYQVEPNV